METLLAFATAVNSQAFFLSEWLLTFCGVWELIRELAPAISVYRTLILPSPPRGSVILSKSHHAAFDPCALDGLPGTHSMRPRCVHEHIYLEP